MAGHMEWNLLELSWLFEWERPSISVYVAHRCTEENLPHQFMYYYYYSYEMRVEIWLSEGFLCELRFWVRLSVDAIVFIQRNWSKYSLHYQIDCMKADHYKWVILFQFHRSNFDFSIAYFHVKLHAPLTMRTVRSWFYLSYKIWEKNNIVF